MKDAREWLKKTTPQPLPDKEERIKEYSEGYWVHKTMFSKMSEITGKIYTQQQMDEAIEKAFNAGRERDLDNPILTTYPDKHSPLQQLTLYADKYSTFSDYTHYIKNNESKKH
jgi:hypothetical protein